MLFSYAVRAVYIEASSMFVRGGVYRVVQRGHGRHAGQASVSALLFDYVLTGPISAVTAGQYLAGFIQEGARYLKHPGHTVNENYSRRSSASGTVYFWWKNIQGIHESSDKALRIMRSHGDGGDPDRLVPASRWVKSARTCRRARAGQHAARSRVPRLATGTWLQSA